MKPTKRNHCVIMTISKLPFVIKIHEFHSNAVPFCTEAHEGPNPNG